jgi:transcriptional regulator with XRE-family HTH domain
MDERQGDALARKRLEGLGTRVRSLRLQRHLTQQQLAEMADINEKYIGHIERGRKDIRYSTLYRLADGFRVDVRTLFD